MENLKSQILGDLVPRAEFAEALGKSERTIMRLGVPVTYIGSTAFVSVSKGRAHLLGEAVRKRGRPRHVVA